MPYATLATDFDFKDFLAAAVITSDCHIAVLKVEGFIRSQAGVRHKQHEVIDLFGIPFEV
jgi:hypothetical protein